VGASVLTDFDHLVGMIAGAVYSEISTDLHATALMLIPAITFKVRKVLEPVRDLRGLSNTQKDELAKDLQIAIIPMLFSYEIDPVTINKVAPAITFAAAKAIKQATGGSL
jgi:hypothetical protein